MVSATTYTLVGVVNKFITVLLSVLFLDKHASNLGIAALLFCLLSGTLYQQADKRDVTNNNNNNNNNSNTATNSSNNTTLSSSSSTLSLGEASLPLIGNIKSNV